VARAYYGRFDPTKRYVYFPLHQNNDAQITVRNPHFYQQDWLVEYLARSVPQEYLLYVKGHPGCAAFPISTLRRLAAIPNVRLLAPSVNSHEIIEHAAAVAIINSSVGVEALVHCKPVVVLGKWFCRGLGVTFDVPELGNLASVMRNAIDARGVDKRAVQVVLYSLWKAMYSGQLYSSAPDYDTVASSVARKAALLRECCLKHEGHGASTCGQD
jgi:capsule polysaccharide export protein KpsC/LpsZ